MEFLVDVPNRAGGGRRRGGKVSIRLLVGAGFGMTAYALYAMTGWTPDVSEWTVISTGFIQGLSIGFVFVPLSAITFATLPTELRTQATGIYSLMRNIGSAIGISVTGALLQSNTQVNHAGIAAGVTPFNRLFQSGAGLRFWNPATPNGATALNGEVTRQASIIAYIDDFKLMLILVLAAMPLILVIRTAKSRPAADDHAAVMD